MANRNKSGGGGSSGASGGGRSGGRTSGTRTGSGDSSGEMNHGARRDDPGARRDDEMSRQPEQDERGTRQSEMGDIGVTGGQRGDIPNTPEQQHRSARTGTRGSSTSAGRSGEPLDRTRWPRC